MLDNDKSKKQLINELNQLRIQVDKLSTSSKRSIVSNIQKNSSIDENLPNYDIRNRILIENSPICTKVVDLDFNLQYMSSAGVNALKIDDITDYYGTPYPLHFYPDSFSVLMRENLNKAKETGETIIQEAFIFDTEGNKLWFHSTIIPVNDNSGQQDFIMVLSREITEKKKFEKKLIENEAENRLLINNSPYCIHQLNLQGQLISMNAAGLSMMNVKEEHEIVGLEYLSIVSAKDKNRIKQFLNNAIDGKASEFEFTASNENEYASSFIPIKNAAGEVVRLMGITRDITENKKAENALKKVVEGTSKQYGNEFFNSMALQISDIIDADYTIIGNFHNDKTKSIKTIAVTADGKIIDNIEYELCDTPCENVVGKNVCAHISNVAKDFPKDLLLEEMGVEGYIGIPLFDSKEKALGILVVLYREPIEDLDFKETFLQLLSLQIESEIERYNSEKALRNSESSLIEAQKIAKVGNWSWNLQTNNIFWSEEMYTLYGLTNNSVPDKEVVRKNIVDENLPIFDKALEELSKGNVYDCVEYRFKKNDGSICYLVASAKIDMTDDGKISRVYGTLQDITERKLAEETLIESEESYRSLADSIPDCIMRYDLQGRHIYQNLAGYKVSGFTKEQFVGKTHRELGFDESLCCMWEEHIQKVIETGKPSGVEFQWKSIDGIVTYDWHVFPEYDREGKVKSVLGLSYDITETKRLQELSSRAERLETAGTIAGQVAHDFNNLLAPLMAYPEFIRDELPMNHPTLKYLDKIEKAAHQIADINQDLLAMGRRGHYNLETLNLNTIIHQVLEGAEPFAKTLICVKNLSPDLMYTRGGGAQLHRMISNIIHNAIDSMQDVGQLTVKTENYYVDAESIHYGCVAKGEYVKLTISDTGCGIPDDIVQKIFDPFFTSKTADKKRGSGLGMSVVDSVIKDHNGYIDLSTQVGIGTSFYIYLPITRDFKEQKNLTEIVGGNESILIVDDDEMQREVSSHILKNLGYDISCVCSGAEALLSLQKQHQDLVILDMVMPGGIDGAETYRQILEFNKSQKALIVSGFSESARVNVAQQFGVGAFVKKPFTKSIISRAVRTELDRKENILV